MSPPPPEPSPRIAPAQMRNDIDGLAEVLGRVEVTQRSHSEQLTSIATEIELIGTHQELHDVRLNELIQGQEVHRVRLDLLSSSVLDQNRHLAHVMVVQMRHGERLDGLGTQVTELKADMVEVKADVSTLKADMVEVKADVSTLKADMVEVKADIRTLKADMVDVKAGIVELKSGLAEVLRYIRPGSPTED